MSLLCLEIVLLFPIMYTRIYFIHINHSLKMRSDNNVSTHQHILVYWFFHCPTIRGSLLHSQEIKIYLYKQPHLNLCYITFYKNIFMNSFSYFLNLYKDQVCIIILCHTLLSLRSILSNFFGTYLYVHDKYCQRPFLWENIFKLKNMILDFFLK